LLAAPPERGELQEQLKSLAAKKWCHPINGQRVQFGLSTIERWFYTARKWSASLFDSKIPRTAD
jgi:putative transposase